MDKTTTNMKIEAELRKAIVDSAKGQRCNTPTWKEKEAQSKLAITALDKKLKGKLTKLFTKFDAAQSVVDATDRQITSLGLNSGKSYRINSIGDNEKFEAAGGVLPEFDGKKEWKPEQCIARLTAAKTQAQFDKILTEYDIVWK